MNWQSNGKQSVALYHDAVGGGWLGGMSVDLENDEQSFLITIKEILWLIIGRGMKKKVLYLKKKYEIVSINVALNKPFKNNTD